MFLARARRSFVRSFGLGVFALSRDAKRVAVTGMVLIVWGHLVGLLILRLGLFGFIGFPSKAPKTLIYSYPPKCSKENSVARGFAGRCKPSPPHPESETFRRPFRPMLTVTSPLTWRQCRGS